MRILTNDQKDDLEQLFKHRWFKVLEQLAEEFENSVLKRLKNIDLDNEKEIQILWKNQNYLRWVNDFMNTIKTKTNKIGKKDI